MGEGYSYWIHYIQVKVERITVLKLKKKTSFDGS